MNRSVLLFVVLNATSLYALANECDCSIQQGSCTANLLINPTGDAPGLYGANIDINTSVQNCARVDYYVDSTPYFTILPSGRGGDRLLGASQEPLSAKRVVIERCIVCKINSNTLTDKNAEADNIFENALSADSAFDPNDVSRKLDELDSSSSMPSTAAIMGVAAGALLIQQSEHSPSDGAAKALAPGLVRSSGGGYYENRGGLVDTSATNPTGPPSGPSKPTQCSGCNVQ